jgi:hypothetical protein
MSARSIWSSCIPTSLSVCERSVVHLFQPLEPTCRRDTRALQTRPLVADLRAVRSRLILKLISLGVLLTLTVIGAHAFTASSPSSPLNPVNVARSGLASICADEQASAAADGLAGAAAPVTVVSPSMASGLQASDPAGLRALEQAAGGSLTCPTTTTGP